MPGDTDSLVSVSANGTTIAAAQLALATKDHRAKCFILDAGLLPDISLSLKNIYDSLTTFSYRLHDSSTADVGIGLIHNIGHLATVDSASDTVFRSRGIGPRPANSNSFSFIYAFKSNMVGTYLGVEEATLAISNHGITNNNIAIFPNPSNDVFNISGLEANDEVLVYDLMGRRLANGVVLSKRSETLSTLSGLPAGNWMVMIKDKDGITRHRERIIKY